jgi:uncharacterized protein
MTDSSFPVLSLLETRILGVLAEKQYTVPDSYPLTLNSLILGCSQKTSRNPIMDVSQSEVLESLDSLRHLSLVIETSGGRVARYAHNFQAVLRIPEQSMVLLAILMLRGPQTAGELRTNSERLYRFADISSVESFLRELAERALGALVMELPRQPGMRENRWIHLLSDMPVLGQPIESASLVTHVTEKTVDNELIELKADVSRLEAEVHILRKIVDNLCVQLGVSPDN